MDLKQKWKIIFFTSEKFQIENRGSLRNSVRIVAIARSLPAITSSLLFLATPVAGMIASTAILGEALTVTNLAGLVLIVLGLGAVAVDETR